MAGSEKDPLKTGTGIDVGDEQKIEGVRILWETEPSALHVDFATVTSRTYGQFALVLCAVSPKEPTRGEDGKLVSEARIVASTRLTPVAFLGLTQAMVTMWNQFAKKLDPGTLVFEGKAKDGPAEKA